jgi:hypothetical protein
LRSVKVATLVLHSGRRWGGAAAAPAAGRRGERSERRGPAAPAAGRRGERSERGAAPAAAEAAAEAHPPQQAGRAAGGVGGRVGGLGRMQHQGSNYKAIQSLLTRLLCCTHKVCRGTVFGLKNPNVAEPSAPGRLR